MKSGFVDNAQKKKKKPSGATKRKKKREQKQLVESVERLKLGPNPLWKFIVDHPDIFEAHVLLSGNLNGSDIKMFYGLCRASRNAIKRAKIELRDIFLIDELSSVSTMELAWDKYPFGETRTLSGNKSEVITLNEELFCIRVAYTNDLNLLKWAREVKERDWNYRTSGIAAKQGNLEMLKYCVENGCDVDSGTCATAAKFGKLACLIFLHEKNVSWDERTFGQALDNNHIECITYAVKNKCPGYERYEQFVPK